MDARRAAAEMKAAAEDVVRQLDALRPGYFPERVQLIIDWRRRRLEADLLALQDKDQRLRRLDAYCAEVDDYRKAVNARKNIDLTAAAVHLVQYAVAEAELLRSEERGGGALTPEGRAAEATMANEEAAINAAVVYLETFWTRSPAFLALKVRWIQAAFDRGRGSTPQISGGKSAWRRLIKRGIAGASGPSG